MALGHPMDGRVLPAAGEAAREDSEREGEQNPAERKWMGEVRGAGARPGSKGTLRVSPDPLRSTDRYRLVTPFKLEL